MNSIDYNAALDQIAMSVRGNSEAWIIDHREWRLSGGGRGRVRAEGVHLDV
jgi:hypothetical protein